MTSKKQVSTRLERVRERLKAIRDAANDDHGVEMGEALAAAGVIAPPPLVIAWLEQAGQSLRPKMEAALALLESGESTVAEVAEASAPYMAASALVNAMLGLTMFVGLVRSEETLTDTIAQEILGQADIQPAAGDR